MKEIIQRLQMCLQNLKMGDLKVINDVQFCNEMSIISCSLIDMPIWDSENIRVAELLIEISNILYNNTSCDTLILDDGIYDQLLVIYKKYNPNYKVGAIPINYNESAQNEINDQKIMCACITDMDSKLFIKDIWKQNLPISKRVPKVMCGNIREPISKRLVNTQHKYPELVGTLDKCKFVINNDAINKGVFDKPSVQVFERDFIHKCLAKEIISPTETFQMIGELKYDGVSVEAEIKGDTIIKALSRGDTNENIATDLTPILGGYKFPFAKEVPSDFTFGMKFEAIITKRNLEELCNIRQKKYKNCRNAIIGLFGSSDAYKYINYITLIPLATSLELDRIYELNFMNHYYNSGEYNRFVVMQGNYQEILFQVKQFTESAEIIRKILPYMIDGVVISFIDPIKIKALGRENSVNNYQMAIKFNPSKVRTNFIGYTYSVGKSGDIIPMVHFKPCEFIGSIHTKQTIHSYERFKNLNLAIGEQIDIEYVNDVISYVTKPDTEWNRNLKAKPEEFIKNCPSCNSPLVISDSGKSIKCINPYCHEKMIMRMVDMVDKLGFKDIAEESIRLLNILSLSQLINLDMEKLSILGPKTSVQFMNYINNLLNNPINDYKIMSALSFNNMGDEKWKVILKHYTIDELFNMNQEQLYQSLTSISGIGNSIVEAIISGLEIYDHDIEVVKRLKIINSKGKLDKPKVVLTGFRDQEFIQILIDNGFDADEKYNITKNTAALIANDKNSSSSKINLANKYGIPIYTKQEFIYANGITL